MMSVVCCERGGASICAAWQVCLCLLLIIRPDPSLLLEDALGNSAWLKKVGDMNEGVVRLLYFLVSEAQLLPVITMGRQRVPQGYSRLVKGLPPRAVQDNLWSGVIVRRQCQALCQPVSDGVLWRLFCQVGLLGFLPYRVTGALKHAFMPLSRRPEANF